MLKRTLQVSGKLCSTKLGLQGSTHFKSRFAGIRPIFGYRSSDSIKRDFESAPTDMEAIAHMNAYMNRRPLDALNTLHAAIHDGKLVGGSDEYIRQYLTALVKADRLQEVDMKLLLSTIRKVQHSEINNGTNENSSNDHSQQRTSNIPPLGQTPFTPLYISSQSSSTPGKFVLELIKLLLKLGFQFLALVVALEFISELVDTRGSPDSLVDNANTNGNKAKNASEVVHRLESRGTTTLDDVIGVDEVKAELAEILVYLKDPQRFTSLGGTLPKGILLTGPPGTGKTLLARALAGEAQVPFFYISGSEFEEMYVGVGAKRVREVFKEVRDHVATHGDGRPGILFIDEIDAIGGKRSGSDSSASRMTLNQLLVELDGFATHFDHSTNKKDSKPEIESPDDGNVSPSNHGTNPNIIVIAATNFPESLDPALVRPGRFDKRVELSPPDLRGRLAMLKHFADTKIRVDPSVDLGALAKMTQGFSGAELNNLMNQSAVIAGVKGDHAVTMQVLEAAREKILLGPERRSLAKGLSQRTLRMTAFHESGHALVSLRGATSIKNHTDGSKYGPIPDYVSGVAKATILPRGQSLGAVVPLPRNSDGGSSQFGGDLRYEELVHKIDVLMAGRAAEEVVFGMNSRSLGASSDLEQATRLARGMVNHFGLSSILGPVVLDSESSPETRREADLEVRKILQDSYNRTRDFLIAHREDLNIVAEGLLEFETLSGEQLEGLLKGNRPELPSMDRFETFNTGNKQVISSCSNKKEEKSKQTEVYSGFPISWLHRIWSPLNFSASHPAVPLSSTNLSNNNQSILGSLPTSAIANGVSNMSNVANVSNVEETSSDFHRRSV